MQKRIIVLLAVILTLTTVRISAQDAHFSQFYANPLYLNPAFAGTNICPRISLSFRDQWPAIQNAYLTYSAAYDQHFDKLAGGIGVLFVGDRQANVINTYQASVMYAFKLKVSKKFNMRLALQATYINISLDWNKLTFPDMIDPKYGFVYPTQEVQPGNLSKSIFDVSAGFIGYTDWLFFGLAVNHLTSPPIGFQSVSKMPVKWTAHIGGYFDLKRKSKKDRTFGDISISPNFIYQHQRFADYFNYGFYLCFYPFTVGLGHRIDMRGETDALTFVCGVQYDFIKVGYSYDITLSKLANMTGGAHEVSLQFLLPCPPKQRVIKDLKCPSF
jgi:type IX secretion system PorP/SprF family membrane protein